MMDLIILISTVGNMTVVYIVLVPTLINYKIWKSRESSLVPPNLQPFPLWCHLLFPASVWYFIFPWSVTP